MASHIHQALREIRFLKQRILEKQMFTGYSGRARAVGGSIALMAGIGLQGAWFAGARLHFFGLSPEPDAADVT